ncbi:MAG: ion channel [Pseudomonadota bacterium]
MSMTGQILVGFGWTVFTLTIAVGFITVLVEGLDWILARVRGLLDIVRIALILTISVVWMLIGVLVVVFSWAFLFQWGGVFQHLEDSFYFAIATATTVGYGDVVAPEAWRIVAGFAAADGFIVFGLDTAVLFDVLRRLREEEVKVS